MPRRLVASLPLHRHSLAQMALDTLFVASAYFLAFQLRFDGQVTEPYRHLLAATILPTVIATVVIFALFGLYNKWWRYVGQRDYEAILRAVVVATLGWRMLMNSA